MKKLFLALTLSPLLLANALVNPFTDCLLKALPGPDVSFPPGTQPEIFVPDACYFCNVEGFSCHRLCDNLPCHKRPFDISCSSSNIAFFRIPRRSRVPAPFRPGAPFFYCVVGSLVYNMKDCPRRGFCRKKCALCGVRGYDCPAKCAGMPASEKPYEKQRGKPRPRPTRPIGRPPPLPPGQHRP